MARASYQSVDNIRIGNKPTSLRLIRTNSKSVMVCPSDLSLKRTLHSVPARERKPLLSLHY
jgi:hypothetical protein